MPGHKRNKSFLDFNFLDFDLTEIHEMDNLNNPQDSILESQKFLATIFGSDESCILVNGSTTGILASILAVCSDNDSILIARNSHRSAYAGIFLSGAFPRFILPEMTRFSFSGAVSPEKISKMLSKHPDIKAVFITSPTFEGVCSDIQSIADVVHSFGKILIVDEAHGAHFNFNDFFPKSAVLCGADIVIQSLHKTLPAPTQCSLLHINGHRVDRTLLKQQLAFIQTSSPSYIFMGAIEHSIRYITENNFLFEDYISMLNNFYAEANVFKNLIPLNESYIDSISIFDFDKSKLVFFSGLRDSVDSIFRDKFKIQLELCGLHHFIAMTSVADTEEGFYRLLNALKYIDNYKYTEDKFNFLPCEIPEMVLHPRKAFYSDKVRCLLHKAEYQISASFLIPYPPGIPIVAPGELITKTIIDTVLEYCANNIPVIGVYENTIEIIRR